MEQVEKMTAEEMLKQLNGASGSLDEIESVNVHKKPEPKQETKSEPEVKSIEEKQAERERAATKNITKQIEESITNQSNVDYESTVTLPSKGLLYKGEIPAEISLRGMTTRDEKILYAAQGTNVFQKLLKSCITDPSNIDVNRMVSADEMFLILQLRMITYGPEYKVDMECPYCGRTNTYTVMLNDLDINYLDDDFDEKEIETTLPIKGDRIGLRLLRNYDTDFITKYSRKFSKQFNIDQREVEYSARIARQITSINGRGVDFETAIDYVDNLRSRDTAQIRSRLNKINFGADMSIEVTCKSCDEDFDFVLPLTSEFFRPTFE